MLIIIIWLLLKFAPFIIFVVGKVVVLPFKCIGAFFKGIGNSAKRRKEKRAEKREQELRHEKKVRCRQKLRNSKTEKLPDNVWMSSASTPLGHKPVEEMSRDEIENYLDNIDWSDPYWSGGGSK